MEFNLLNYINEGLVVMIPVLYILGVFLKKSRVRDELIPWFLLVISIVLCGIIARNVIQGIIQGVLVTGVCVLGSQLYIQTFKK
ncbi:MAG: phage holin family protein [Peptostreptococcus sp.]|uniref:phage holin family protein n=1 Tax=Peptostreptococcus TaxID=1257 RepID=UPI0018984641|nr:MULTISPECIES: phage holin family protein [Peptostreptococcus]MDB8821364.1 phage holin family protein [Peptostreptococcus anaerobius]MDB8825990.1 phage holin family protein [Peptostreptococcus anaerobius]MDB8827849.1 phage holin family protein [Peptostreptococcus anaerobius]MDB8829667.1 phage holin family protein [Peptostreptococcus anaerobius]MDB8831529.1 phage holin family protein [Peptostreptococcus anaerobius]